MFKDDLTRIQHIVDAGTDIAKFTSGKNREDLDKDRMLLLALVKCIEIIGEAANNISPEFRSKYSQIPWRNIISMRNYLIHVYFDVDYDVTWDTVTKDVPDLLKLIKEIDSSI